MLERKLGPIIRQLVVTVVTPPDELVVPSALAGGPEGQVHPEHVLGVMGLCLDGQVPLLGVLTQRSRRGRASCTMVMAMMAIMVNAMIRRRRAR